MRNVIVHLYERVDYNILRESIGPALRDFSRVVALFEADLHDDSSHDPSGNVQT